MRSTTISLLTFAALSLLLAPVPAAAQDEPAAFRAEDVERARAFWVANATARSPLDCLLTLNEAMRLLYDDRTVRLGSTVDLTMAALQRVQRAQEPRAFGFLDANGRPTSGVVAPERLRESLWDGLVALAGGVPGWHLFGVSLLDGNHSVVLALDLNDPDAPTVFWADQWSTKGGWLEYPTREALDGEVERLTSAWWRSKLSDLGIKFRSDTRVYVLVPTRPAVPPGTVVATVQRASRLNLRSGPGTDHPSVGMALRGEQFEVSAQQGLWARLRLEDGSEAWAHRHYLDIERILPGSAGGVVSALPIGQ